MSCQYTIPHSGSEPYEFIAYLVAEKKQRISAIGRTTSFHCDEPAPIRQEANVQTVLLHPVLAQAMVRSRPQWTGGIAGGSCGAIIRARALSRIPSIA
jgi:hypothetical protein